MNSHLERTLLFIHGNSHSARSFNAQLNSETLKDFRLISVDLPGHGDSSKEGNYTLKNLGFMISEFIKNLDLTNIIIVGHSLGGHVAINTLKYFNPDGLFLFGTPPLKKPVDFSGFLDNPKAQALRETNPNAAAIDSLMEELNYSGEIKKRSIEDFHKTDSRFRLEILSTVVANTHEDEIELIRSFYGDVIFLLVSKESLINNDYIRHEFSHEFSSVQIKEIHAGHSPQIEVSAEFDEALLGFANQVFEKKYVLNNIDLKQTESRLW